MDVWTMLLMITLVALSVSGEAAVERRECFDWASLPASFDLVEMACEWWHNRIRITHQTFPEYAIEFRTSCFVEWDLEAYDSSGNFQGRIKHKELRKGFRISFFDCNNQRFGYADNTNEVMLVDNQAVTTNIKVYNQYTMIGYSVKSKWLKDEIHMRNMSGDIVTRAKRDIYKDENFWTCKDHRWNVTRRHPEDRTTDVNDPKFMAFIIAIEALNEIGKDDMCGDIIVWGCIIGALALACVCCTCIICCWALCSDDDTYETKKDKEKGDDDDDSDDGGDDDDDDDEEKKSAKEEPEMDTSEPTAPESLDDLPPPPSYDEVTGNNDDTEC